MFIGHCYKPIVLVYHTIIRGCHLRLIPIPGNYQLKWAPELSCSIDTPDHCYYQTQDSLPVSEGEREREREREMPVIIFKRYKSIVLTYRQINKHLLAHTHIVIDRRIIHT